MNYAQTSPLEGFGLRRRMRGLITAFKTARARRAAFDRAYTELRSLDDRELMDLGLSRSDFVDLAEAEANKVVPI
ncbi:DUF1127 domain-containing protein [Sedimentitalea todarodis]|uniref:DUF1127 domain-containing protein n=1 Tax=Sedimentitalea todarodis TaxID=1631240 RepID=A0ABU3VI77_9RHOB|nr:DUF1127 domain-containing protein [Sedimentitalea todarodis]MDU9005881.1 DUF1127 domain-containing protein [Sedimentitalea todarodis]